MLDLVSLQQDRNHKVLSLKDLVENAEKADRVLTVEEQSLADALHKEIESLEGRIENAKKHLAIRDNMNSWVTKLNEPAPRKADAEKPAEPKLYAVPKSRTSAVLKAFKGPQADERAYRAGMWLRAAVFNDYKAERWCASHGIFNALEEKTNSAGGYLVPEEFNQAIIDLREEYGVLRRECRVVPMGRDTIVMPRRVSGVTASFIGENPTSGITQSTPTWNQVRLTAKQLGALVLMSADVAEDAVIDLADWLAREFAYQFAYTEDLCGFVGTGTSTYGGIRGFTDILKAGQSLAGAVDAASGVDTFAEVTATDLANVMAKLPAYARPNAKWYCSSVAYDLVFGRLMAAANGNAIQNLMGGYGPAYLGYPIVISQVLPTSTGDLSDAAMLLFGDLSLASAFGDRRDTTVFPSEHRYMDTNQLAVRATERFDFVVHDYGDSTTAGPVVALVGE